MNSLFTVLILCLSPYIKFCNDFKAYEAQKVLFLFKTTYHPFLGGHII